MRVVIIEDETAAAQNLTAILRKVCPDVEIVEALDTVVDSVEFFRSKPELDLVFMDIHLADGSSFRIFDSVEISVPIIFTTAYDQYAIEAFKVNSIDYLLKPINEEGVKRAINKWQRLTSVERNEYSERVNEVAQNRPAEQTFLVHFRDKIIPLKSEDVAFFHTFEERVTAYCHNGDKYQIDLTLEALQSKLPSEDFFRANRQFIISRKSVKDISVWFGSRLSANLTLETPERIVVPKARVHDFKEWLKR
ncbi:MAG: response regulator transcription factor [Alistipes sp.]|jgi:DNA-binding LytR/AlgR family response regulator|nr:response regulator transcription factor [Alistipes sp.]